MLSGTFVNKHAVILIIADVLEFSAQYKCGCRKAIDISPKLIAYFWGSKIQRHQSANTTVTFIRVDFVNSIKVNASLTEIVSLTGLQSSVRNLFR